VTRAKPEEGAATASTSAGSDTRVAGLAGGVR
jgi:hypothetical protein